MWFFIVIAVIAAVVAGGEDLPGPRLFLSSSSFRLRFVQWPPMPEFSYFIASLTDIRMSLPPFSVTGLPYLFCPSGYASVRIWLSNLLSFESPGPHPGDVSMMSAA